MLHWRGETDSATIFAGDAVTNLREEIIYYRIQASLDLNDKSRQVRP